MSSGSISNGMVSIRRDQEGNICGLDLTDTNNEPSFYTKSKRGLDGAWAKASEMVTNDPKARMSHVLEVLDKEGIKYHLYCAVD